MIVVVFRSRIREGVEEELLMLGEEMYQIASSIPGFLSYKEFQAEDGEIVSLVEFETEEALATWADHPEHRVAQQRGQEEFFTEYHIQVCEPIREYRYIDGNREEIVRA